MTPQQKYNRTPRGQTAVKAAQKRYYAKPENKAARAKRVREHRHANPEKAMLYWAKKRAKEKNILFSLTLADVTIPRVCPVLGIPLVQGSQVWHRFSPSLDRFDLTLGYVPGNVRVISHRANQLKNDASIDELRAVLAYMESR